MKDRVFVYFTKLPPKINEMVAPCSDGYTIYIDVDLSPEAQRRAYRHAMRHITNGDWEKNDVDLIEVYAHKETG